MTAFFIPEMTGALAYTAAELEENRISLRNNPTECTHILLPIPTDKTLLSQNFYEKTVFGGNLPKHDHYIDLLKNEDYLMQNAAITADCAETLIRSKLPCRLSDCNVLILGWGRIGKCLSQILSRCAADIAICSGSHEKRCLCKALGFTPVKKEDLGNILPRYRVIINTVPSVMVENAEICREDALLIDLASVPGIIGSNVIWARGLPGKMEPEASGKLIGKTVLSILKAEC